MSIESRVVPAIGETITRFSLVSAFTREDFPAFGFPMIAILVDSSYPYISSGKPATIASSKSPILSILTELIAIGSPNPSS